MQRLHGDTHFKFWFNRETGSGMYEEDPNMFATMWLISIDDITATDWEFADEEPEARIKEKYSDSYKYVKGIGLARK